jgi:uncharacterized membrane protein
MKKQTLLRWTFVLAMISIPWLYLAVIWSRLPERIPVHFGINGNCHRGLFTCIPAADKHLQN